MGKEGKSWVGALLGETYFGACSIHAAVRKNERNVFCAHCCVAICQHCLPFHRSHSIFQIRRYVYNDVIRLDDIQQLVDCEHVQAYIVNSAKVVFLNQRPQSRPAKGVGNACKTCDRVLQDGFRFCSLACRVDAASKKGEKFRNAPLLPSRKADQDSPNRVFLNASSSGHSPSSSVSTANDSTLQLPHDASAKLNPNIWAANFPGKPFNQYPSISSGLSKVKGSTFSCSHSSSSPATLKWGRTSRWPATSKLAKRLPFSPYSNWSHTKPSYSFDHSISCYRESAHGDQPMKAMVCSENLDYLPLPKRRKGMPQRSPIC